MLKARVFISCGQRTIEEKQIGDELVSFFKKNGFEPYYAEEVHSPSALTESIFNSLDNSEYFICVNHHRDNSDFGSLFIQQELAIASYKKIPLIAFHEPSIKLEGVAKYLHINSIPFKDLHDIIQEIDKILPTWDSKSKNQFALTLGNEHLNIPIINQYRILSNWYHIIVENLSSIFTAKNCYSFVESINDLQSGIDLLGNNEYKNELVWSGTGRINVNIPYKTKRDIDAIYTKQGSKDWTFQEINTSTLYRYPTLKDGHYKIIYVVHSDNFPEAKIEIEFELANDRLRIINQTQIR